MATRCKYKAKYVRPYQAVETRFWAKANLDGSKILDTRCWEWTGSRRDGRYGQFWINGERGMIYAHRFAFELEFGPVPAGRVVCHRCDNQACVNCRLLAGETQLAVAKAFGIAQRTVQRIWSLSEKAHM